LSGYIVADRLEGSMASCAIDFSRCRHNDRVNDKEPRKFSDNPVSRAS